MKYSYVNLLNLVLVLLLILFCKNEVDSLQFTEDIPMFHNAAGNTKPGDAFTLTNNFRLIIGTINTDNNLESLVQNYWVTHLGKSLATSSAAGFTNTDIIWNLKNESLVALNSEKTIHVIAGLHSLFDATSSSSTRDVSQLSSDMLRVTGDQKYNRKKV